MNLENIEDIYNLSPLQEGVLFQALFEEHPWVYFQQLDLTLQGRLDIDCFAEAWQRVMDRTTALRTSFEWQNLETPLQVVHRKLEVPFRYEDWRNFQAPDQRRRISAYIDVDRKRGFTLTDPPLVRLLVLRMTDSEYRCLISYHHILLDGWSLAIVLGEVFSGYEVLVQRRDLEFQPRRPYRDYIGWLQSQDKTRAQHFWTQNLEGFTFPTPLPLEHRAVARTETGEPFASEQLTLSREVTSDLQALGRRYQLTLNTIVQGAWALLLSIHSGERDVVYGSTVSGRSPELPGIEAMVGLLINTLPVRATIMPQQSLTSWLADFQLRLAELTQFEYSALVEIQKCSNVPAGLPLFESLVVFENYPLPDAPAKHEDALRISKFDFFEQGNYPLTISVGIAASLVLRITYDRGRFDSVTIKQLLRRFEAVFTALLAHPEAPLDNVSVLSESERQQMLVEWNDTKARAATSYVIPDLFEQQVRERGDAIALVSDDLCLTYNFLNQQANLLAHLLLSLELEPDRPLGIFLERSPLQIICLLAILKAGAPYLALDQALPARRLALLIELADLRLIIAEDSLAHLVPPGRTQVLCPRLPVAEAVAENPVRELHPDQLAYVCYTSGSTGTPKAVAVRQRAVVRLVLQSEYVRLAAEQRLLHAAPLSFDASTFEIWGGLLRGGTVVLLAERVPQAAVLGELIRAQQVRTMWLTASLFNAVVDEDVQQLRGLEQLVIGGEALSVTHVERVRAALPELRLVNGYGPTEATTFACTYELSEEGIAIGRPIAETDVYVLGERQQLLPLGVVGELYLGGEGLARGYSNSSELTAEKFVPHGYSEQAGARLYRTGDLVRYRSDGALEYVGRRDHQVKLRGFRIELGEIEAALRQHDDVEEAVVLVGTAAQGKRLLAYVVTASEPNVSQYQQYLRERLPEYMIPAVFVRLEQLPLTASGKVDRRALPQPSAERPQLEQRYVAARTPVEQVLVDLWTEVLGLEKVGIEDNYFELGGDSILSIRLASKGQERGLHFRLHDIFSYPTIRELAAVLEQKEQARVPGALEAFDLITEADRQRLPAGLDDAYPLTRLQAGMLFHGHYEIADRMLYHSCFNFHLQLRWNEQAMSSAVERLVERHAVLRTSFDLTSFSEPLQLVHRDVRLPLEITDLRSLSEETQQAELAEVLKSEQERYFDWKQPPLIRFHVVRRTDDTLNLVLAFHHAILDGWSLSTLLTELFSSYWYLMGESETDIEPPPRLTYRHYLALEQQALASEEARLFWDRWLSESSMLQLPQRARSSVSTKDEQRKQSSWTVPAQVADGLKKLARDLGVPVKSVLLASHLRVLSWLGQQPDIMTGLVSHGRLEGTDGERVAGLFLNTLPLRVKLEGGTWAELVQDTFAAEREMLPHRLYPLSEIQRAHGQAALFDVSFNYTHFHVYERLDEFKDRMSLLGTSGTTATNFTLAADFNLTYPAAQMRLILAYDASRLSDAQMQAIENYYARTLAAMAGKPEGLYELESLLSEAERHQLLREWCDTSSLSPNVSIASLFTRQAERTPDAVALIADEEFITYQEIDRRSNQLARYLRAQHGSAETLVGICLDRSPELFWSILGVVKAGGVYVPLDPTYPPERLAYMIADGCVSTLITQRHLLDRLPSTATEIICLDTQREQLEREADAAVESDYAGGDQPLYVIYTSGSTGRPKGVVGLQRGALNRFQWMWEQFPFTAGDVCCAKTSLGFVDAVWEVFGALLQGVATAILDDETVKDPRRLLSALARHRVTRLVLVPSLLRALLAEQARRPEQDLNVRLWISSGEELPAELAREFQTRLPSSQLVNLYGSSEVSADVSWHETNGTANDGRVAIGRPIANTEMLLLDGTLSLVPFGVVGDLYVGGEGLARGYLRRPELTAAVFLPNPFAREPGERIYRTGDTARYDADGRLEYLGRRDHQVKIRGYRTELGEIEAALREVETVREAVVMLREIAGEQRLLAYLVAAAGQQPVADEELLRQLRKKLPAHMIPATFVWLESMPLTPSGKINRSALPVGETTAPREVAYVGPRNAVEQMLADIWEPVLGKEKIGVHHNFFDLGGHSLLATRVVTRMGETFNLDLPLKYIFENPTISELGKVVVQLLMEEEPQESTESTK